MGDLNDSHCVNVMAMLLHTVVVNMSVSVRMGVRHHSSDQTQVKSLAALSPSGGTATRSSAHPCPPGDDFSQPPRPFSWRTAKWGSASGGEGLILLHQNNNEPPVTANYNCTSWFLGEAAKTWRRRWPMLCIRWAVSTTMMMMTRRRRACCDLHRHPLPCPPEWMELSLSETG